MFCDLVTLTIKYRISSNLCLYGQNELPDRVPLTHKKFVNRIKGLTSTQLVVLIHCNYDRGRRYSDLSLVSMREPFIATPTRLFAIVPYLSFACPFTCSLRGSSHHVATFSSLAPHFCMSYHSCSSTNLVHHTTRYYTNDPSYNIKIT